MIKLQFQDNHVIKIDQIHVFLTGQVAFQMQLTVLVLLIDYANKSFQNHLKQILFFQLLNHQLVQINQYLIFENGSGRFCFGINYSMLEDLQVDQAIRLAILNLCVVLYDCGITEIHVGGIMRVLGVPDDKAAAHDLERMVLDGDFVKYVEQINAPRPNDQTLH